jgi:hypothetical protein
VVRVIADGTSRVEPTLLKLVKFIDLIAIIIIYVHTAVYISLYIVTDNCENLLHSVCEPYDGPTGALSVYVASSVQQASAPTICYIRSVNRTMDLQERCLFMLHLQCNRPAHQLFAQRFFVIQCAPAWVGHTFRPSSGSYKFDRSDF